ncbi:hypothetical protein FO519_003070 [Halicephalobus sp. NKZ332]|nr:hypothetical protein FO519_003070 [Halicephalobus sp. NKZ332]
MNIEDARPAESRPHYTGGHSIETVKGVCGIPARLSGFFSWAIQLFILVLSAVLTALIFLHIGGYAYFINTQNNSTGIVDFFAANLNDTVDYVTTDPLLISSNETDIESENIIKILQGNESEEHQKVYHGPFEQIEDAQLVFWDTVVIELLPLLRTINLLYIVLCIIWLVSLGGLLLSLKLELLDLFCPNIFFLMTAIISLLVQSLGIGILIFFQKEYNWPILLVICGTVGGLLVCFFLAIFAFTLLMVWYKYIDYMNNRKDAVGNLYMVSSTPRLLSYTHALDSPFNDENR